MKGKNSLKKERNKKILEEYISKKYNRSEISHKYRLDYTFVNYILKKHGIKEFWDSSRIPDVIKENIIRDYKINKISRKELSEKYKKNLDFINNILRRNKIKIWDVLRKNKKKRKNKKESKYLDYKKEWYNSIYSAYSDPVRKGEN